MKFSVIIPLYNKAPYIRKALESVFAQTYTDYELIVVDDGSSDDSAEIVESILQEANKAIRLLGEQDLTSSPHRLSDSDFASSPVLLVKQQNQGVSAARNNGVAQAQGDYIAFLDADDWWEPTYLERMAQLITDYPEAGLYGMNYIYYKPGKTRVALKCKTGYINYPKEYYEGSAMMIFTSSSSSMPKRVFEEMGGFPVGIKLGEDFLLWAKTALHYPVAFCEEPLAYYNNDVPVNLRATRNLHHPNNHMLFRMELAFGDGEILNQQYQQLESTTFRANQHPCAARKISIPTHEDWKRLIDKLRVGGLLEYWMSKEYHDIAAQELAKVDWSQQPDSVKRIYKTPIWLLKAKRQVMKLGSCCKQRVYRLKVKDYRQGL